jgi:L-2,4-diaminobutyric acid acetyltransferase
MSCTEKTAHIRTPDVRDGARIHEFVRQCPPLECNSAYAYLLIARHFNGTSAIAEDPEGMIGFVAGYRLPDPSDVLFIWQVGVSPRARGSGLARRMLEYIVSRPSATPLRYLEATVAPSNESSRRLFRRFAAGLGAPCEEIPFFEPEHFGGGNHEAEALFRIGPFR